MNFTPSTATEVRYLALAIALLQRAETVLEKPWGTALHEVVSYYDAQRRNYGRATWRQYRAALTWYLRREGHHDAAEALRALSQSPCIQKPTRTSAKKSKHLPADRLADLIETLAEGRGRYDVAIGLWILANEYTGLRPVEWWYAELIENRILVVRNAKATQGRTFGPSRTLSLASFREREMGVIQSFLSIIRSNPEYRSFYTKCRDRLLRVNNRLWPRARKHITLYSARHQFAADHKIAGYSLNELAALLGHASNQTAQRHYGRRQYGRTRSRVSPSAEDVQRVQALNATVPANPEPKVSPRSPAT